MNSLKSRLKALYKECFSDSKECRDYLFSKRFGPHNAIYRELNSDIVAAMYMVDKKLVYREKETSVPFVVGLGTSKAYRKMGLATELIRESVQKCEGPFIMLYPAVKGFYEKMDFAVISYDNVLTNDYKKIESEDAEKFLKLYELYNKDNDFYIRLNKSDFEEKIEIAKRDGGKFYLLEKNGEHIGFTNLEESVILGEKGVKRGVMARVANLEKAFKLCPITIDKKIKLTDKLAEENNFCFFVEKGRIQKCEEFDIELTMEELTKHFFGLGDKLKEFGIVKGHILERY